jgi:hypothetical protein
VPWNGGVNTCRQVITFTAKFVLTHNMLTM